MNRHERRHDQMSNTRFLASVSTPAEAVLALAGGADIIDIKDAGAGALGAVAPAVATAIVRKVDGARLISATVGDVPLSASALAAAIDITAASGVDIVKVGWFGPQSEPQVLHCLAAAAQRGVSLVVVLFAEYGLQLDRVAQLAETGIHGVMLDTLDKQTGGLCSKLEPTQLVLFSQQMQHYNLFWGLAGSLRAADVAGLLALQPDYLGFRGALCAAGKRTRALQPALVRSIRALFDQHLQPCTRAG